MGRMVRCSVNVEPSKKRAALYVLGIFLGINALIYISNKLPPLYGGLVSIGIIIGAGVLTSYLINRKLAEYTYTLIDNELMIFKRIGSREKLMMKMKVSDIESIVPLEEEDRGTGEKKQKVKRTYTYSCRLRGEGLYVGILRDGKHRVRFMIEPEKSFVDALQKSMNQTQK